MYCWEAAKRSHAAITVLLLFRDALPGSQRLCADGRLKTAKCEWLWSSVHCPVQMFVKQSNRRLQQLLAVENKTIVQQLKPSTLYVMFQLTLIFYPHHTGMRSQMLYPNGSFEICQERMCVKQRWKDDWSIYLLPKKTIYAQAKIVKSLHVMFYLSKKVFE